MTTNQRLICVTIICGAIVVLCVGYFQKHVQVTALDDDVFKLSSSITCLIVGDSHTETALDPDILPCTANISKSAENFYYTYYKLKHYLKLNQQIRRVVLGASYHNFTKFSETYIFDDKNNHLFIDSYYLLLDADGRNVARSFNANNIISILKYDANLPVQIYTSNILLKKLFRIKLKPADFKFNGQFNKLNNSNVSDAYIDNKIKAVYKTDSGAYVGESKIMTNYFIKILSLCRENNIELYLFNGPIHHRLLAQIPAEAITYYDSTISNAMTAFKNVKYINYVTLIQDTNFFSDGDHVNTLGSGVVSKQLLMNINNFKIN